MKRHITSVLCMLLIAAGCSQSEKEVLDYNEQKAVAFTANYASTRATETSFEQNDEISVYAFDSEDRFASDSYYANNKRYIYSNGFNGGNEPIYYPEENTPLTFYAIYPYNKTNGATFTFRVKPNQSEKSSYTQSDLMTAVTPLTTEIQPLLSFYHRMSSALISIDNQWEGFNISSVSINNLLTSATINLTANNITANEGNKESINAYKENGYKSIFPPQSVAAQSEFVTINGSSANGNVSLIWKLNKKTSFKSGMRHEYKLVISKNGNVYLEGYNEYDFNAEIIPWGKPDNAIEEVIPPAILEEIEEYMPIYRGVNPPNVEGCYLIEPNEAVYCQDYPNGGGYEPGKICNSEIIRFTNQNNKTLTLDFSGKSVNSSSHSEGTGSFISGEGNNFTVYFDTEGESQGIYTKMAKVYSGTISKDGIINLHNGFIMVDKGDDPERKLMDKGVFRLFKDKDGLAANTTWEKTETRSLDLLPNATMNRSYWIKIKNK